MAPFFMILGLSAIELGRSFEVQQVLSMAAREGARLGAMDREGLVREGQTSSEKIESDIRAFLNAAGLPGDKVAISITHAEGDSTFNFDDPDNHRSLFRIHLSVPYSDVSVMPSSLLRGKELTATVVFRNGRSTMVQ